MIVSDNISKWRFLIIAGTSKAGTTSLFNYFAGHPQVCPAQKETRFFLDPDYPLASKWRHPGDDLSRYFSQFQGGNGDSIEKWRFEATPDYLYSSGCAEALRKNLSNVQLVFILREPISRLISWYRFARKRAEIPSRMTFDEYVRAQTDSRDRPPYGWKHPAWCALSHGCYSRYLQQYSRLFDSKSIRVFFYEDLRKSPSELVRRMCEVVGLDKSYFSDYSFSVVNKGSDVKSRRLHVLYRTGKEKMRSVARDAPTARRWMRGINKGVDRVYNMLNVRPHSEVSMSTETRKFLISYYGNESDELSALFGVRAPWPGLE
jgi:hypothetical protein